eukprot:PITA_07002
MHKYLTKFTQCWDELGSVGVTVDDQDLVSLALLGLPKSWHSYQDYVNGREKLPGWKRLWSDLVQEEIRQNTRDGSSSKESDEENGALATKEKKENVSLSESSSFNDGKKVDKSKVRCFRYHEVGHYASNCPQRKSKEGPKEGSKDVKGYRLLQPKSKNVIIRRDIKFAKNISAYEPNSTNVPPLSIPSTSKNIPSLDDAIEDENPPPPSWDPPSAPQLPKWMHTTRNAAGAPAGDPIDQRCTHSQFDRAFSLLDQTSTNYNLDTFGEALGHPDWDTTMNEEYCSLLENDTWDLVPLSKGRKLVRCKWAYRTKFGLDGKVDKHKSHLVAKGFSQVEGIDYTETFSHVE